MPDACREEEIVSSTNTTEEEVVVTANTREEEIVSSTNTREKTTVIFTNTREKTIVTTTDTSGMHAPPPMLSLRRTCESGRDAWVAGRFGTCGGSSGGAAEAAAEEGGGAASPKGGASVRVASLVSSVENSLGGGRGGW